MVNYLVCIDGSEYSKASFFTAINMMDKKRDHLYLLSVAHDGSFPVALWDWDISEATRAAEIAKRNAQLLVHKFADLCKQANIPCTAQVAVSSHVGEAICQVAEKLNVDFLIMSRRGMSSVKRFFVGSVTSYCVEHANCNVLVLKGEWQLPEQHNPELKEIVRLEEEERRRRMKEAQNTDPNMQSKKA